MMGGLGRTTCVVLFDVGDGDDEIDEDGGGRGGGGGKWHFGTDQCTTDHQAESVIQVQYEKTPMYDVGRENRYPSSGIQ